MTTGLLTRFFAGMACATLLVAPVAPALAAPAEPIEQHFDRVLGAAPRALPTTSPTTAPAATTRPAPVRPATTPAVRAWVNTSTPRPSAASGFEAQLYQFAAANRGRIGVAALDLDSGRTVAVLGDQPFPMASTSKIAIVATFLDGVDKGRWKLTDRFPMMYAVPSARFAGKKAPVRPGQALAATTLIDLAITRSDNHATDALLAVVGGPAAVNRWMKSAGLSGMRLDRDIATLVRDDGEFDPARTVDPRDSATPLAMVQLLQGLHEGRWLTRSSNRVLLSAMERCVTGRHRMRAGLPEGTRVAHKTGTLNNTSSDVGFIRTPDGRTLAVAIYVTGQGSRANRDSRIAAIARTIFDGYQTEGSGVRRTASR